jgi:hypothetical protein
MFMANCSQAQSRAMYLNFGRGDRDAQNGRYFLVWQPFHNAQQ